MKKRMVMKNCMAFLLCLLLAACSSGTGTQGALQGTDAEDEQEVAEERVPDGAFELDFWMAGSESAGRVMQDIINAFNGSQEDWFVHLTLFASDDELYNEVLLSAALRTLPDMAVLDRNASAELHEKNQTVELTQIVKELPGYREDLFLPVYFDQGCGEDGTVYALALYGRTKVMFYNKGAFAHVKMDPSTFETWQDLAKAAYRLQQRRVCTYGWELHWGYDNMLDAALSNGGRLFSEDGRTVTINTPEWIEVWEQFRTWIHEDQTMRLHSGGVGDEWLALTQADVADSEAGGYTGSSRDLGDLDRDKIGIFAQPKWDAEKDASPGSHAYLFNIFSESNTTQRQGAEVFLRYLIDVPTQVKWTMETGYVAVNRNVLKDATYQAYTKAYPDAKVLMEQSRLSQPYPPDPTGNEIKAILRRAADKLLIENLPAQRVLDDAQREAQRALDEVLDPLPEEEEEGEEDEEGEEGADDAGEGDTE